jgi:hypothetical protein
MTDEMCEVAAIGWELRLLEEERGAECWFAVEPHALPAAHELAEKGWLARRIGEEMPEWRLSEQGLSALRITSLTCDPTLN